ncbi:MAG: response regulator [Stellaceae bacterium]
MARILLVEDDPDVKPLLEHVLVGAGYQLASTKSAKEALTLVAAVDYDMVVTDWRLPDGDGRDVADAAVGRGAKAIIITGYGLSLPPEDRQPHTFLLKPIRPSELLLAVGRTLGEIGSNSAT